MYSEQFGVTFGAPNVLSGRPKSSSLGVLKSSVRLVRVARRTSCRLVMADGAAPNSVKPSAEMSGEFRGVVKPGTGCFPPNFSVLD